jgi:serralysin
VDTLNGGLGDDSFLVDANDIVVEAAGEGEDTILTSDGRVMEASVERLTLQGTASVDVTGNVLGNRIVGNDGNNRLSGLSGLDSLFGGAGDDSLEGGAHRDNLTGGAGADRFIFTPGSGNDTVTDFDGLAGPGGDALDFTAFGITLADLTISSAAGGLNAHHGHGHGRVRAAGRRRLRHAGHGERHPALRG